MIFINLLRFLFVIYTTHLASNALSREGLVSNNLADPHVFIYQVAIMGKPNGTNHADLQCSGGIIARKLILTAAQCFITDEAEHKPLTFFIIADIVDLNNERGIEINIVLIYLTRADTYLSGDIAVAELEDELDIDNNPYLGKLNTPPESISLITSPGVVAGYGYHIVRTEYSYERDEMERVEASGDNHLRFAHVYVRPQKDCMDEHPHDTYYFICAETDHLKNWGICDYDAGSPLVVNRMVVGVASTHQYDCNDSNFGGIYTSVMKFSRFVDSIKSGYPQYGTIIYPNRPHEL